MREIFPQAQRYKKLDVVSDRFRKCIKCNRVWMSAYELGRKKVIDYYQDFPSYGLKKETCKECLNGNNNCTK